MASEEDPPSGPLSQNYHKNATVSPLLRLPPELRTWIWESVLCGHTIHVLNKGHDMCHVQPGWKDKTSSERCNTDMRRRYDSEHDMCALSDVPAPLNLSLLRVSRQIYGETSLLPYTQNTFAFDFDGEFQRFVKRRTSAQQQAIRSIVLTGVTMLYIQSPKQVSKLTNLSRIEIHGIAAPSQLERFFQKKVLQHLEKHPLTEVAVRMTMYDITGKAEVEEVEAWTRAIEQRLLKNTSSEGASSS